MGRTPLFYVLHPMIATGDCDERQVATLRVLLELGADPRHVDMVRARAARSP